MRNLGLGFPGGQWISIQADYVGLSDAYIQFINLYSNQRVTISGVVRGWLTEDLIWGTGEQGFFLFNPTNQERIPLRSIHDVRTDLRDGHQLTPAMIEVLKAAEKVFVVEDGSYIFVLARDYWQHPDQNFYTDVGDDLLFPDLHAEIGSILDKKGISYQEDYSWLSENMKGGAAYSLLSPQGRFIAKTDGVYDSQSKEKVVDYSRLPLSQIGLSTIATDSLLQDYSPRYWRADERILILGVTSIPYYTLRAFRWLPLDIGYNGIYFNVPLPVLKVTLPDELFDSVPAP